MTASTSLSRKPSGLLARGSCLLLHFLTRPSLFLCDTHQNRPPLLLANICPTVLHAVSTDSTHSNNSLILLIPTYFRLNPRHLPTAEYWHQQTIVPTTLTTTSSAFCLHRCTHCTARIPLSNKIRMTSKTYHLLSFYNRLPSPVCLLTSSI